MSETQNFMVEDQIRDVAEFLLTRGLFQLFRIALYRAVFFCRFLASVREDSPLCKTMVSIT